MKSAWEKNPEYIINLTEAVVGKDLLRGLTESGQGENAKVLWDLLLPIVGSKVNEMTSEKLGTICSYGSQWGIHAEHPPTKGFINLTGFRHLEHQQCGRYTGDGQDNLRMMAVDTIICIARDIALRWKWEAKREAMHAQSSQVMYVAGSD